MFSAVDPNTLILAAGLNAPATALLVYFVMTGNALKADVKRLSAALMVIAQHLDAPAVEVAVLTGEKKR